MTNADKIRNMTDDELYEFILGLNGHCLAGIGECNCSDEATLPCDESCKRKTREWLQSEVNQIKIYDTF